MPECLAMRSGYEDFLRWKLRILAGNPNPWLSWLSELKTSPCSHVFCQCLGKLMACVLLTLSQDGLTGSAWGDWANYTASPLR